MVLFQFSKGLDSALKDDAELYQSDKIIDHLAKVKRFIGKALIEENGYSLAKINNATCKAFKFSYREFINKRITTNKKGSQKLI